MEEEMPTREAIKETVLVGFIVGGSNFLFVHLADPYLAGPAAYMDIRPSPALFAPVQK
jgi:hypothetical protein